MSGDDVACWAARMSASSCARAAYSCGHHTASSGVRLAFPVLGWQSGPHGLIQAERLLIAHLREAELQDARQSDADGQRVSHVEDGAAHGAAWRMV